MAPMTMEAKMFIQFLMTSDENVGYIQTNNQGMASDASRDLVLDGPDF